jgi:hypothetical protein
MGIEAHHDNPFMRRLLVSCSLVESRPLHFTKTFEDGGGRFTYTRILSSADLPPGAVVVWVDEPPWKHSVPAPLSLADTAKMPIQAVTEELLAAGFQASQWASEAAARELLRTHRMKAHSDGAISKDFRITLTMRELHEAVSHREAAGCRTHLEYRQRQPHTPAAAPQPGNE